MVAVEQLLPSLSLRSLPQRPEVPLREVTVMVVVPPDVLDVDVAPEVIVFVDEDDPRVCDVPK